MPIDNSIAISSLINKTKNFLKEEFSDNNKSINKTSDTENVEDLFFVKSNLYLITYTEREPEFIQYVRVYDEKLKKESFSDAKFYTDNIGKVNGMYFPKKIYTDIDEDKIFSCNASGIYLSLPDDLKEMVAEESKKIYEELLNFTKKNVELTNKNAKENDEMFKTNEVTLIAEKLLETDLENISHRYFKANKTYLLTSFNKETYKYIFDSKIVFKFEGKKQNES